MERKILGITRKDRKGVTWKWVQTKVEDILLTIKMQKWS